MKALDRISEWALRISSVLTVLLVLLTFQQVVARYFFSASSVALQELQWHLFAAVFLLGTAATLGRDEHVRVDIIYGKLSRKKQALINIFGYLVLVPPTLGVLLIYGFEFVLQALDYTNPRPHDFYSAQFFTNPGFFYEVFSGLEGWVRTFLLIGESSADPGGLEARWLVKSLIPLAGLLLALQSISQLAKNIRTLVTENSHA